MFDNAILIMGDHTWTSTGIPPPIPGQVWVIFLAQGAGFTDAGIICDTNHLQLSGFCLSSRYTGIPHKTVCRLSGLQVGCLKGLAWVGVGSKHSVLGGRRETGVSISGVCVLLRRVQVPKYWVFRCPNPSDNSTWHQKSDYLSIWTL